MLTLSLDLARCPEELRAGLAAVMADFPTRFGAGTPVAFAPEAGLCGHCTTRGADGIRVAYGRRIDAFRAVGHLLGLADLPAGGDASETGRFDTLGIMVDCSRNGVITVEAAKNLLRRCALMGLNTVMLYTEDTYQVPGEPFFGYLRGPYTHDELKALDDYAFDLGIEMIPCIQTLGHLEQILQWPAYAPLKDVNGVLIAEEEATYALVEKLIAAASAPVRSKRIHIGMDEAHGVGTGRYRELHGEKSPFEVLNAHLDRVRDICAAKGLRPMIWSDMYFRLGSKTHEYYDKETVIPQEVIDRIPKGVDLVYWDYYHAEKEFYDDWITRHRGLGSEPVTAGGGWTWDHFWAALPYAFTVTHAFLRSCREQGVREFFLTLWGDDGMENDIFSALPAMQLCAEYAYAETVEPARLAANFRGACGAEMEDWFTAAKLDYFAPLSDGSKAPTKHSKWLLYQDPLLALMEPNLPDLDLRAYYGELADTLATAAEKPGLSRRLQLPALLARVLSLKTHLRRELSAAYIAGDTARLRALADGDVAALRAAVDALWRYHHDMWLATYKPFGLEVIEQRYGGLRTRLESLALRLRQYLAGEIAEIPELTVTLEKIHSVPFEDLWIPRHRVTTPSCIKP